MQEVRHNLIEDPGKWEIILLPVSAYQKKDGSVPVPKDGFLSKLVEKYPNLVMEMGSGLEKYGSCPAILNAIPGTKFPTKFATFPVAPTSLRAKNPDDYVFNRLRGRFKPYSLLPGWTLTPRSDILEFAAFKLAEIIRYYKLTKVALPFEMLMFDREDKADYTRTKNILTKYLSSGVSIVSLPAERFKETIINTNTTSSVSFEE